MTYQMTSEEGSPEPNRAHANDLVDEEARLTIRYDTKGEFNVDSKAE